MAPHAQDRSATRGAARDDRSAGATEIVVADSHGNGENLLIERFPPEVTIVPSWPRKLSMMGGLDETFDAALFIGEYRPDLAP